MDSPMSLVLKLGYKILRKEVKAMLEKCAFDKRLGIQHLN